MTVILGAFHREVNATAYHAEDLRRPFTVDFMDTMGEAGMALEMRDHCEKCEASLAPDAAAYICSYECTFCGDCTQAMNAVCPNCGGELLRRPKRRAAKSQPADPSLPSPRAV